MGGGAGGEAGVPVFTAADLAAAVEAALQRRIEDDPVLTADEAGAEIEEPPPTLVLRGSGYPFAAAEAWRALRAVPEDAVLSVVTTGDPALDAILDVSRELGRRVTAVELGAQRWSLSIQPGRRARTNHPSPG